jgi:transposase
VFRLDLTLDPRAAMARRVEAITGGGERRWGWSNEAKAQAIEASLAPGVVISEVARRHGLTPQQSFTWRRDARRKAKTKSCGARFAPVVVDEEGEKTLPAETKTVAGRSLVIELDVDGSSVLIRRGADIAMLTAIVGTLKASG